jgi:hypothetical protein
MANLTARAAISDLTEMGGMALGIRATPYLNLLFLVEAVVILIATLFCSYRPRFIRLISSDTPAHLDLFYFNRLTAILVSFILRLFFWKKNNAHFEIGSIQFAPLRGRILFTDIRYTSRNQTLRVLSGSFSPS